MSSRFRVRSILVAVAALVLSACSSEAPEPESGTGSTKPAVMQQGGTVTVAVDQEPVNFNPRTLRGNTAATGNLVRAVLPSVWTINDRFQFELDRDIVLSAEVMQGNPQTIVYRLNPDAVWSDGVPVSADDFILAFEMQKPGAADFVEPFPPISVVAPNENLIASVTGSDGGKTVTVVLSQQFADWQAIFLTPLVPAHQARVVGWNTGFEKGEAMLSAGPFRIASHNRGKDLTLVRNERYRGTRPNLDSIVVRFVSQSDATLAPLRSGEVNVIAPRIQVDLREQVAQIDGVRGQAVPSQQYEYLDFKLTNKLLAIRDVRRAFALALDRSAIVARTVGQVDPGAKVLNSRLFLTSQKEYVDTSDGRYDRQDVPQARRLLEGAGFTTGPDGIYVSSDGSRLSFSLMTTSGDALRDAQGQLIQAQARQSGIEVTLTTVPAGELGRYLTNEREPFEIANVGQVMLITSGTSATFGKGGTANVTRYSNEKVDSLYAQARAELDQQRRTAIYLEIDRMLWEDMPRLPLYQRPNFVASRTNVLNVAPSPALGVFWNVEHWGLKAE